MKRLVLLLPIAAVATALGVWSTRNRLPTSAEPATATSPVTGPRFVRTEIEGPAWVMALPRMTGRENCLRYGRSALTVLTDTQWTVVANLWFASADECRRYVAAGDMPPGLKSRDENIAAGDARWPRAVDTLGKLPGGGDVREEASQTDAASIAARQAACAYYEIGEVIRNARCQIEGSAG